jgi:hypothetical protein
VPAPVNTVLPVISGSAANGQTLTISNGTWSNTPTGYAYQWQRCDQFGNNAASITGAVSTSYLLLAADVAHTIRCVVTATNGSGSTAATSVQTTLVVEAVANASTLLSLRTRSRSRSDTVNDAHITDAEMTTWINLGLAELHDFLVDAYDEILTVVTDSSNDIQIVAGQASYPLPADFYKMMGVDYLFGTRYQFTMTRFMPRERNRYQGPFAPLITGRLIAGVLVPQYRVREQYIDVIPQPSAQMGLGKMRLYYIKQFANLVLDTDYVDPSIPNGWEDYAVLSAAAAALTKQERDPSVLMAERAKIEQRITRAAQDRDAGEPMRVVDVNRLW